MHVLICFISVPVHFLRPDIDGLIVRNVGEFCVSEKDNSHNLHILSFKECRIKESLQNVFLEMNL